MSEESPRNEENHQLSITKYIAAPPEKIWQIMTERFSEWWCPTPWRAEIDNVEWRSGGRFDTTMYGPDGEVVPGRGIFLEVTPPSRLVFTDAVDADWNPQGPFMVGMFELQPEGDGTRYTASARHWTKEAMEQHEQMGFTQGWGAVADQLARLAEAD
jgi:uncharacterized protein YndB with AHSA1/START domain